MRHSLSPCFGEDINVHETWMGGSCFLDADGPNVDEHLNQLTVM